MGQEQPAVSIDGPAVNEKADEKRSLADDLRGAADAVTAVAAMLALRNPGSLFAMAQEMSKQIVSMGTRLVAGRLAGSAMTSDGAAETLQRADARGVSELEHVEDLRTA